MSSPGHRFILQTYWEIHKNSNLRKVLRFSRYYRRFLLLRTFLGPRGPLVLPSMGPVPSVRPSALKIWITYIQAYMPYESCKDSSNQPYGPMASLGCPLDPLGPPGTPWQPPNRPPQTHKQVSWPHCTLKIPSAASKSYSPSTPSPMSPRDGAPVTALTLRP